MDFWISIFKVISMISTGVFGSMALVKKFKDDEGLTKWGRVALGGIVLSSIVSLTLFALETREAKKKAQVARAQTEATTNRLEGIIERTNILRSGLETNLKTTQGVSKNMQETVVAQQQLVTKSQEISAGVSSGLEKQVRTLSTTQHVARQSQHALTQLGRLQYPLSNISVQAFLRISMEHPLLVPHNAEVKRNWEIAAEVYRQYRQSLPPADAESKKIVTDIPDKDTFIFGNGGRAEQAGLQRNGNAIIPPDGDLYNLFGQIELTFQFFKHEPTEEEITGQKGDLLFTYILNPFNRPEAGYGYIRYDYRDHAFHIFGSELKPVSFAATSKDMFSVLDLSGSTLVVSTKDPKVIDKGYSIPEMLITTQLDQRIIASKFTLRQVGNTRVLVYRFPSSPEQLFAGQLKYLKVASHSRPPQLLDPFGRRPGGFYRDSA